MQNIKTVIDIWNWFIKWAIFAQDEWKTVVLLKETVKTKGMRKGKFLDTEDFIVSINNLIESFVKKLWWEFIDEVVIWISHPEMLIQRISEQKRVMNEVIRNEDIDHLSKIISDISAKNNYEVIKILPVYRLIDEHRKEKDPLNLQAKRLELVADIFYLPRNFYTTLVEVFDKLNLNIIDIVPNILSASESVLDFDLKDLWTLLIDIGTNQTSYAVFEEWYPVTYWTIPMWWEEVTKDISICLQLDIKESDELKKEHWIVLSDDIKLQNDWEIDRVYLASIITARYEEMFSKIQKHLSKLWKDWRLPWWVILIWWWAKIENLDWLTKKTFKLATFYWKDKQLWLWEFSNNIQFSNVIWWYIWANKYTEWRKSSFKLNFDFFWKIWKFIRDLF